MARVLVIDDDEDLRGMLGDLLQRAGYSCDLAENGIDGMEKFRQSPPDVVITDIFMPEKDGFQVIQEMKKANPKVKIIVISGIGIRQELDIVSLALRMGVQHALEKPFKPDDLLGMVRQLATP